MLGKTTHHASSAKVRIWGNRVLITEGMIRHARKLICFDTSFYDVIIRKKQARYKIK